MTAEITWNLRAERNVIVEKIREVLLYKWHFHYFVHISCSSIKSYNMARTKPDKKSKKSPSNGTPSLTPSMAPQLLDQATTLLHSGQPEEALPLAQKALQCLSVPSSAPISRLPALELLGEINIELGDPDTARSMFLAAVSADPDGVGVGMAGGAADKFLWLAQLSEEGGEESVMWFGKGAEMLRKELAGLEGRELNEEGEVLQATKRMKLANALCGAAEVYMTDLSYVLLDGCTGTGRCGTNGCAGGTKTLSRNARL